eukprot:3569908-Rhodomonas_salina.2
MMTTTGTMKITMLFTTTPTMMMRWPTLTWFELGSGAGRAQERAGPTRRGVENARTAADRTGRDRRAQDEGALSLHARDGGGLL